MYFCLIISHLSSLIIFDIIWKCFISVKPDQTADWIVGGDMMGGHDNQADGGPGPVEKKISKRVPTLPKNDGWKSNHLPAGVTRAALLSLRPPTRRDLIVLSKSSRDRRPLVASQTKSKPVMRVSTVKAPTKRTVIVPLHRRPVGGVRSVHSSQSAVPAVTRPQHQQAVVTSSASGNQIVGGQEESQAQEDNQWQTEAFRHSLVWKLQELIRDSGASIEKNAVELEREVFSRANTKEEYLGYMARLIFHINGLDNEVMKLEERDSGNSKELENVTSPSSISI